jgi:hypothetical protein
MTRHLAVALIAAFFIVGCGSDESAGVSRPDGDGGAVRDGNSASGDSPSGSREAISKSQFVLKADKICQTMITETTYDALPIRRREEAEPDFDPDAVETMLVSTILIPDLRDAVEQLEGLGAPPGDEEQIEKFLDATREAIDDAEADPEEVAKEAGPTFAEAEDLAEAYGLGVCPYG